MKRTLIASLILMLSINIIYAGWTETFETAATPDGQGMIASDITWAWWGWGSAAVADGSMMLVGADDPFGNVTSWIQTGEEIDANAPITPESVTMYLKIKFTTTGTPTDGDQIHICVATDPSFLTNLNVYTVVSSPVGIIGQFYFAENASVGVNHPAIAYDVWWWEKIVVDGQSISVWAYADGGAPADTATYSYTADNVAIGTGMPSLIIAGVTDDDSSTVLIDEIWYNETPPTSGISDNDPIASNYKLGQNYPNPFNPITNISYTVPQPGAVKLAVFNVLGEKVSTLVNNVVTPGTHTATWDAGNMPSGVYFYRLDAGSFTQTRKLLLIK
ncbi:MAG: T9SS type A sorting domain-containing protein [Candidatus Neomarinimicrobiota bacterium]|nr:T9SS type A sorting domain-containing protein [Candidatus Neomarinimicrobiota bacterium]